MTDLPPHAADTRRDRLRLAVLAAAVAGAVLVAHWPAMHARAVIFDDYYYFIDNPLVTNPSWNSVGRFFGEVFHPSTVKGYYQPLAMTSLMLDYAIGGRAENLGPFHRTSLALHVLNTVLLVVLLYQLFGRPWPAALAGLLFGMHPLNVETIPWVAERKTLLATFFVVGSMIVYVRYVSQRTKMWLYASVGLYVLAQLSKPTSAPLPVLLLALDYWPLRRLRRRAVVEKWPFYVVGAGFAVITLVSQARTGGTQAPGDRGIAQILMIVCHNVVFYLRKFAWPADLSVFYPYPEPLDLSQWAVLAGVIGTVVIAIAAWASLLRTRSLATGLAFFFLAIFPAIGVIGFTNTIAADRFMYLPMVGLLLPIAAMLAAADAGSTRRRIPAVALALLVCAAAAMGTRYYLWYWQDSVTLYRRAVTLAPQAPIVRNSLSTVLVAAGRTDEAVANYRDGLAISPKSGLLHAGLAAVLERGGDLPGAIEHYRQAAGCSPHSAEYAFSLAGVLRQAGRVAEAIDAYRNATLRDEKSIPARLMFATMLLEQRQYAEAAREYRRVLEIEPGNEIARQNLAVADEQLRRQSAP